MSSHYATILLNNLRRFPTLLRACRASLGRPTTRLLAMLTVAVAWTGASPTANAQSIIYVNAAAPAGGNGQSWATAYRDLQQALDDSIATPVAQRNIEVWIAPGIYRPSKLREPGVVRSASFVVPPKVSLIGGFAGGEVTRFPRQPRINVTVLTGDLQGDDTANFGNRQDNAYRVVLVDADQSNVVLDGLTVRGGNANGVQGPVFDPNYLYVDRTDAAGIAIRTGTVNIISCEISDNFASGSGAGIMAYNRFDSVAVNIQSTAIFGNTSVYGAAVTSGIGVVSTSVVNCTIANNSGSSPIGGSILYADATNIQIRNTIIWENRHNGNVDITRDQCFSTAGISGSTFRLSHCLLQMTVATIPSIPENISPIYQPPVFTAVGGTVFGLAAGSPGVDAGSNSFATHLRDLVGNRRRLNTVDIGSVETASSPFSTVLYANQALATGQNNGSSWANAIRGSLGLRDALAIAATPNSGVEEVWVTGGTYKPSAPIAQGGSRSASFNLQNNLAIYGGFQGNETLLNQRNVAANVTILSGDLNGDDNGDLNRSDNSFSVVTASQLNPTAVLDGVTVADGNASGSPSNQGGGILIVGGTGSGPLYQQGAVFRNLTVRSNLSTNPAGGSGGAVSVQGSGRAQFERTTFADNRATNFGGAIMQNVNSHVSFRHCVFDTNSTTANGSTGGAMYLTSGAVAYLTDCSFVRNESRGGGGAIHVVNDAGLLADNCKFHGNKCLDGSGGALFLQNLSANPSVDIRNSTIVGNTALGSSADAAAINSGSAFSVFTNCTIVNNESRNGSAVQVNFRGITFVNCLLYGNTSTNATGEAAQTSSGAGGSRSIQYSTIQGWSGSLGGTNNNGLDPMFIRAPSRGPDGFWGTFDDDYGDLRLSSSSPAIDSGDSFAVPADTYDIDNDGNTTEALPLDLDGQSRFYDDPTRSNTGNGTPPIDRGAYENNLATSFWANPLGGRWDTSSNWNGGTPNSAVRAVFDATANAAIVPVTFPSNQSAYSLTIPDRIVNFNMRTSQGSGNLQLFAPGNDLNAPSLLVGQGAGSDATLSINNTGTVFRSVIGTSAVVGGTIGSVGRVAVSGQRSGLELATSLDLGYAGVGLMDVLNRASVDVGSLRLAEGAGGQASLSIAGSGGLESSLLYGAVGSDEVVVGGAGTATVTVSDGGTFAAGDFVDRVVLGRDAGSVGTVVVDGPTSLWASAQDQFVLGDRGTANLSLLNGAQLITSTDSQIVLAREPGSVANITIGDGSNWTEDVQSVVLAGQGTATLNLLPGSSLNFQNNLIINPAGTISGSGTITGGIFNVGTVEVGNSPGTLTINGAYRQLPAVNDPDPSRSRRSGRLELEVGGTSAGQYDQLIVNGPVTLGGGLTVSFANGFTPPSNLNLKLVNPEGQVAAGQFDVAFVPLVPPVTQGGLPRFVRVTQDDGPGGDNGIFIGVGEVPRPYEPQAPQGEQFDGRPVVAAVGDFDGVNGPDLAVAVPGATPAANGTVVVFRNAGTSNGSWNGYEDVVTLVPIGPEPVDMVAVDMDGRLRDDLVVATRGDMSVRVLLNDGGASAFALRQQIATGVAPTTVAAAVLFEDGEPQSLPDIVVGLDALASNVYFLEGNDSGFAPLWVAPSVPSTTIPIRPRVVRPTGTDGDKRVNLLIAGEGSGGPQSSGGVSVIRNDTGEPVSSWDQFNVPVGINPVGMAVGDLNGDGLADAVVANAGDGSISVVLNRTNMIGPVDLAPAVSLPIVGAGGAISIALGDLDGDRPGPGDPFQDLDIAVIAGSAGGGSGTSVYTLRNDTDPSLGGAVTLTQPVPLATTTQDPLLVVTANVDESISNTDDVIGLSESGGGFLPLDNIVARPTPPDVVGLSCDSIDFNNDASFFDPTDIEAFLSVFSEGPCIPDTATCSDIDFNNDGALFDPCDIDSFLLVFSEGPCTLCGQ